MLDWLLDLQLGRAWVALQGFSKLVITSLQMQNRIFQLLHINLQYGFLVFLLSGLPKISEMHSRKHLRLFEICN